jgi:chemotaxis protein methyltransferase CheR
MNFDDFLKKACPPLNLDWRKYRRRAARHRVNDRIKELGLQGYASYLERLRTDPAEAEMLPDMMLVTVSRFFREGDRWEKLKEEVLPQLLKNCPGNRSVQAWSIGCCGGEEPFTLALLWLHYLKSRYPGHILEILGTDMDTPSLNRASQGVYTDSSLREVPKEILHRWFHRGKGLWKLDTRVQQMVRFRHHHFMKDPLPGEMDLVFARYLPFTYYQGIRRHTAAQRLWLALRPGGALMIGCKEDLGLPERDLFESWPDAEGFSRRKSRTGAFPACPQRAEDVTDHRVGSSFNMLSPC